MDRDSAGTPRGRQKSHSVTLIREGEKKDAFFGGPEPPFSEKAGRAQDLRMHWDPYFHAEFAECHCCVLFVVPRIQTRAARQSIVNRFFEKLFGRS